MKFFKHSFFESFKEKGFSRLPEISLFSWRQSRRARVAVDNLMENSRLDLAFFVMCGLSGILAALGILLNDVAILISAMVLAPLLNPVLAFAAGISILSRTLIFYALKSFLGSVFFIVLVVAGLVKILIFKGYEFDISFFLERFSTMNDLLFLAAFISGFSGVYAWLRSHGLGSMVGVAIAVSLIPFVSFFGILLGLERFDEIHWFMLTFGMNLSAIIAGALLAFLMLGFSRRKDVLVKEVDHNTED